MRRNRCVRLNEDCRVVAHDEAIEIQNDQQKEYLGSRTIEGVQEKSKYLAVSRACKRSQQKKVKLKSSTERGSVVEYMAIEKLLNRIQPTKSAGRKLTNEFAWKHVDACKIQKELKDDSCEAVVAEIFRDMSVSAPSEEPATAGDDQSEEDELELDDDIPRGEETDEELSKV